jgi:hypothetical protein
MVASIVHVRPARADEPPAPDPCGRGDTKIDEYVELYAPTPRQNDLRSRGLTFRSLIALVPDPSNEARSGAFDAVLEAVEEAIAKGTPEKPGQAAVHYVRDRSWSPWSKKDAARAQRRCWEKRPGVVLYRPSVAAWLAPTYLVLLVGETPTWGVRTDALEAALDLVNDFGAWEPRGSENEVHILGPTFSGSAPSLAAVLRRRPPSPFGVAGPHLSYSIVSGTATNGDVKATLELGSGKPGAANVSYAATTPGNRELLEAMMGFLRKRGAICPSESDPGNVVLLTESLTAYGSRAGSFEPSPCYQELKFPPDLASIRDAYAADTESFAEDAGVRASSPNDTALARSLALGEVLKELSRGRTRFVGVVATDPHDVINLGDLIRAQLPDIRLFTLGGDIRFVDPVNEQVLDGMLVAHAAPEVSQSAASVSLANEVVRGVYRAGRRLVGNEDGDVVVQISLIGHGALWQIGPDAQDASGASGAPVALRGSATRLPVSWTFVFVTFLGIFALVFGAVVSPWVADWLLKKRVFDPSHSTGFLRHRGFFWTHVGPCEYPDLAADDAFVTAALIVIAGCAPLLMTVASKAHDGQFPLISGTWFCILLGIVLVVLPWLYAILNRHGVTTSAVVFSALATIAGIIGLALGCGRPREATFDLLSGGSPVLAGLVGFTMIGIGLGCWRVRLRFLDTHRFGVPEPPRRKCFENIEPPIAQALGEEGMSLAELERRLLFVIRSPWRAMPAVPMVVLALLVVTVGILAWIKPPQSFEPDWRNRLISGFAVLAFLPITGNFARVVATWVLLRRLLDGVGSHPAVAALKTLPPALVRPLSAQFSVSGSTVRDLAYPLRVLQRLAEKDGAFANAHDDCASLMADELEYAAGQIAGVPKAATAKAEKVASALLERSSALSRLRKDFDAETRAIVDEYTATLLAVFVPRYVRHFRLFVPPIVVGAVLSALMTSLYFVQPARLITSVIFVWVAAMVLTLFVVYVDLDRDVVISGIGQTTAGSVRFDWSFAFRIVSWGLIPLGSLLAAQDPTIGSMLSAFFDSVAKGFR